MSNPFGQESVDAWMCRVLGIDVEADNRKRAELFTDYAHLAETLTLEQFCCEVAKEFGLNVKQAALLVVLAKKAWK